jgi:hypothetical protein
MMFTRFEMSCWHLNYEVRFASIRVKSLIISLL